MENEKKEKIGLCLSGGGYRAMLFHLGALWRLNDMGWLKKLDRISSVSGGSITAGVLAANWESLLWNGSNNATNFKETVVKPILKMAGKSIDTKSVIKGFLLPGGVGKRIEKTYAKHLFGNKTLQHLPDNPRFVFNSINLQSGALWRFSKPYMRDYRVGEIKNPEISLSFVVAASTAFPPFLSPLKLKLNPNSFTPSSGMDLQKEPFTREIILSDGGIYDNIGLETMKTMDIILVSEAGQKFKVEKKIGKDWLRQTLRVLAAIYNQVRNQRVRNFLDDLNEGVKKGTYWGIGTNISDYKLIEFLECSFEKTILLAEIPTRLKKISICQQKALINWGYAVSDAAIRKYVDIKAIPAKNYPFPEAPLN